ncbi:DUF1080 domain-containing protein [Luteolibacter sp. SL250]|uniref:family 16 glycoside hydrolase n=1 Tax=Luteolibacter sp. SL250 TaxID=2995170 RepID=UPI002270B232|nr:family 16 glycoside hydrolase [Luteolibacter sp. SL250]WAC20023.1 DUF1080 domain-containing protein [Luteolibacter sp. SL250]
MKRRTWMILTAGALVGACEKRGNTASPEAPEDTAWVPLTGKWIGTEGGEVTEENGVLQLPFGEQLTAAKWTGDLPAAPFELEYEARRVNGTDFFGAVTFPARGEDCVTFIIGGWGGGLVGISSLDDLDAAENETGSAMQFENGRWYRVRLACTSDKIEAWIDGGKVVDVSTDNRKLSLRPGPISACAPFGFGSWQSAAEIRGARWKKL